MAWGRDGLHEAPLESPAEIPALLERFDVTWVDVQGVRDVERVRALGEALGLHALALEDVVNVHQRPKIEDFEDHLFIVARMPLADGVSGTEQVAMFLGERYLVTFQERPGDCFDPVRQRARQSSRLRGQGPDYLAYALLDAGVDSFFPVLEGAGERIESLERDATERPDRVDMARIQAVKRELLILRRAVWPTREMLAAFLREESTLVDPRTRVYLRDCYDHTVQLMDVLETYREVASGLVELYLSSLSMRMNEVMKVLTVIATIFIPLSFLAGIYGMNFDRDASPWNMPELGWVYGYPFALGLMVLVAAVLLGYFWRRGWLGRAARRDEP
ncbi:MAG: magnesium/cobalt transporter CorA [Chromatiales bacterium]|nr:magnesium/cobalt transporter CorA [Chromatiales bacterium]